MILTLSATVLIKFVLLIFCHGWYFLSGLTLLILSYWIVRSYQQKRAKYLQKVKEEISRQVSKELARDFHDEMGSQLATLMVVTNLLRRIVRGKEEEALLVKMENTTKSLMEESKDFIWAIDLSNHTFSHVFSYLQQFGEKLYEHTPVAFYSKANQTNEPAFLLPQGWSRQIVMIFKEAMVNALKHARASAVTLELQYDTGKFGVICQDNGIGLNTIDKTPGKGLENMKIRAGKMGCHLQIDSMQHKGTTICLSGTVPKLP